MESEDNVFLGASEGSGKFTLTLFAMNDAVTNNKKVVLIEAVEELAKCKLHTLSKLFSQYKVGKTFN